jgi:nucleoside-diphosphate-sugar epimerase
MAAAPRLVCVTGATGFVASNCIRLLLERGYRVRGTVRDLKQVEKYRALQSFPNAATNLQIVQVPDITKPEGFPEAFKGCDYVLHVASPVFSPSPDVVEIAVRGTMNACEAALAAGVKRIVVTASLASMCGNQREANPAHVWSEKDWNNAPGSNYSKSKTDAEKAAWDFAKANPSLELATVHPSLVLGPVFSSDMITSSAKVGFDIASGKKYDSFKFGVCHICDVADLHVKVMEAPEAKNQRYLVSSIEQWSPLEVAKSIKKLYPHLEIQTSEQSLDLMKVSSDPSKAIALLGHPIKSAESAIIDMVNSFIDHGLIAGPKASL